MTVLTFQKGVFGVSVGGGVSGLVATVPREYVHRSAVAEVFLTGCVRAGEDVFVVAGQWPRAHTFFVSADGRCHDPVQVGETVRQVGLYLCHAVYGVPLGHKVLLWSLDFEAEPDCLLIGDSPTDLEIVATCSDFVWQGRRFSGFLQVVFRRDGRVMGRGRARFSCVPPAVYERLRGPRVVRGEGVMACVSPRVEPVLASSVGKVAAFDVVLAAAQGPGRWLLSPDLGHPILFEHANDHHPGMVLVEAARQAAYGVLPAEGFLVTGMASEFLSYAEFDAACWVDARLLSQRVEGDVVEVEVVGHQEGREVFRAQVTAVRQVKAVAG
ncbi:ScbA/BarX family gamma-butyrolactone biosynthesis protein [Streptomyces sp. NPDC058872]|uniref:ScbA/BarX family gamma-butyrolactone biosynthesis protein n=1 Tax=Streptomyces sp. NPDC058872 TaxID=3346661 RepID=UPI00368107F1